MSGWTKGPWRAFYKNKYDEWHVALPIEGSAFTMALCPDGIKTENREADARLISAAPDMAEALLSIETKATQLSNDPETPQRGLWSACAAEARAALAKARGA